MFIIDDNVLDEIRERVDIVDLIGSYVNLKRSGANYMGLCPFHSEKTPSFSVSPSKKIFKCFGCGEGGDVITFIMKRENLGFREAVEFLADKYNVSLKEYRDVNREEIDKKNKMYDINREAAIHFLKNLQNSKKAQIYLHNRSLTNDTIIKYGLGYSKDSWTDLLDHLKALGYNEEELFELNLISKGKSGNYYDRFRDRVMFPIINRNNKVIGFGARAFGDIKPKYLNSRETPIFNKGRNVFNMNIVSKESSRERIILVEGYMDVISLYNSGINYCVASLGTSLTKEQASLIGRMAKEIYICYDSDNAGLNATSRAIDIFISESIKPKIVELKDGLDPDDFIKKFGKERFEKEIKNAKSYVEFKIERLKSNFNLDDAQGLTNFTMESAKIFSSILNPIEREIYVKGFSEKYNISYNAVTNYINYLNRNKRDEKKKFTKKEHKSIRTKDGTEKTEEELIAFALFDIDIYKYIKGRVEIQYFKNLQCRIAFEEIDRFYKDGLEVKDFLDDLSNKKLVTTDFSNKILSMSSDLLMNDNVIDELINTMKRNYLNREKVRILEEIEKLQKENNISLLHDALDNLRDINLRLSESIKEDYNEWHVKKGW